MLLLENRNAVIYGAGGGIGGAVARAFAREGARVYLAGRTRAKLDAVAGDITATRGTADTAEVNALDERAVERYAAGVAGKAGRIDISFTAIDVDREVQGVALVDVSLEDFTLPIDTYMRTQFLTTRAAARHMVKQRSGVILTITATPARLAFPMVAGFGPAWAAVEALSRGLAAGLGPHGIRVVCLRSAGSPEAPGGHHPKGRRPRRRRPESRVVQGSGRQHPRHPQPVSTTAALLPRRERSA